MIKKEKKGAVSHTGDPQKIAALYASGLLIQDETEKIITAAFSRFQSFLRAVYDLPDEPQSIQKKGNSHTPRNIRKHNQLDET